MVMRCFYFSYHYKLPFDVYAYTFDVCTNKVYLLTYLLTYLFRHYHTCELRKFCSMIALIAQGRQRWFDIVKKALIHLHFHCQRGQKCQRQMLLAKSSEVGAVESLIGPR